MLAQYGQIGLLLIASFLFATSMILIPVILRFLRIVPSKPNPVKNSTYECGMKTIGQAWGRFNFRYYLYALVFVVFDVLTVFLYPWAVGIRETRALGLGAIGLLLGIVLLGYVYAWRKKALEWK